LLTILTMSPVIFREVLTILTSTYNSHSDYL
jgi:hypothetical protein